LSTRLEKWAFRIGLLGLVVLVGGFVWQQTHEKRQRVSAVTTTTVSTTGGTSTSTSTTAGTSGTTASTTGTTAAPPPGAVTDPGFVVTSPADGTTVEAADVEVVGTGPAGEVVHMGMVTAPVAEDSTWRMTVTLVPGPNTLTFTVLNSDGTPLYTTVTLTYTAPAVSEDTTSTTESAAPLPAGPVTTFVNSGTFPAPTTTATTAAPPPPTTAPPPPPTTTTAPPPPPTTTTTTAPPPTTTTTEPPTTTTTSPDG
jgi:Glucodextranase, domain B